MKAEFIIHDKVEDEHGGIVEVKVWAVPKTANKPHGFKYSLVYIKNGIRVIGYDNAEGKKGITGIIEIRKYPISLEA